MSVRPTKDMWKRALSIVLVIIVLGFGVDLASLFRLQIVKGEEYKAKAQSQQLSDTTITPQRGTIFDTNMNVLAQSATVWTVYIVPTKIKKEEQRTKVVESLTEILSLDEKEKAKLLENTKKKSNYIEVKRKVENPEKEKITKLIADKANKKLELSTIIGLTQSSKRYYPYNNFASTLLGFTGTDDQGLSGVESFYDKYLTGIPGRIVTAKNAMQEAMPNQFETTVDAKDGNSLVLTIDQVIQHYLEKSMEETVNDYNAKGAYGVVMDVKTGAILAMCTKPDYDVNSPWTIDDQAVQEEISKIADETERKKAATNALNAQWRNRVITDVYYPGSVYKVFMAAAALEEKTWAMNNTYTCTGAIKVADKTMHCHKLSGHGTEDFTKGLENSCNPYFVTVGQKMGAQNYFKYYEGFGFTGKTGIDLPGETGSLYVPLNKMGPVELASCSFGQTNNVTPIQMVTALAALGNGGKLMKPYLVKEILDQDNNIVSTTQPNVRRQVVSKDTADTVLQMMKSVVDNGTGKNGYVAGYRVGGKTGTSTKLGQTNDKGGKKYLASFGAVAPVDDPSIAILIVIDEPDKDLGGGALAAPIAAEVIEQTLKHLNVEPKYTDEELARLDTKAPKVVGQTVDAAKNTLSAQNFKYRVVGGGTKVLRQSPAANASIPSGGVVVLYTESDSNKSMTAVPNLTGLSVTKANETAAAAGLSIKISGNSLGSASVVSYKQSEKEGAKVEMGSVITVYFRHTDGVSDADSING